MLDLTAMTAEAPPALSDQAREAADVLAVMLDGQARTRAELIALTGLGRSTIGTKVDMLLDSGLLTPVGAAVSTGGRPPVQFRFDPRARVVIAADLGATHAAVSLTDLAGAPLDTNYGEINIADGPGPVLDWVIAQGEDLLSRHSRSADLVGVGVGVPGPVEHSTGRPVRPPIMPGWDGYDIPAHINAALHVPVLVDNDVNLMALGEHATTHPGVADMLFVKVATGIGAGIITHGLLHRGAKGSAGDLGHVASAHASEIQCRCGNTGCLEAVASGPAIATRLRDEGIAAESTVDIVNLVDAGNVVAANELRRAGRIIGESLATAVSLLNPSVVVVGGVLTRAGDQLIAGVREVVYTRSLPLATGSLQILPARTGRDAAIAGAAVMVSEFILGVRNGVNAAA